MFKPGAQTLPQWLQFASQVWEEVAMSTEPAIPTHPTQVQHVSEWRLQWAHVNVEPGLPLSLRSHCEASNSHTPILSRPCSHNRASPLVLDTSPGPVFPQSLFTPLKANTNTSERGKAQREKELTAHPSSVSENRHLREQSSAQLKFSSSEQQNCFTTVPVSGAWLETARCLPQCQAPCCISSAGRDLQSPQQALGLPHTDSFAVGSTAHTMNQLAPEKNKLTEGEGSGSAFPICKVF